MSASLTTLNRLRRALHRECLELCEAYTRAFVLELPTESDLRETLHARYVELEALDLQIASHDPQAVLFPDYVDGPRPHGVPLS